MNEILLGRVNRTTYILTKDYLMTFNHQGYLTSKSRQKKIVLQIPWKRVRMQSILLTRGKNYIEYAEYEVSNKVSKRKQIKKNTKEFDYLMKKYKFPLKINNKEYLQLLNYEEM